MRNKIATVFAFGIFFLLLIQLTGTLVESIYILDLMHTSLDAKALGILFFFSPVLLLPFRKKLPSWSLWLIFALLFLARGITPYLFTLGRMLASGLGVGAALLLFPALITAKSNRGLWVAAGLGLSIGISVLLRTLNYSIDLSMTPAGGWIGWILGLILAWAIYPSLQEGETSSPPTQSKGLASMLGIYLTLTITYFAFSAPAVMARWTQGSYPLIVTLVSLLALGWTFLALTRPEWIERISRSVLVSWNLFFTLALAATIWVHRVPFPKSPNSPAVIVGDPAWWVNVPLFLMLLSYPIIFWDMQIFINKIRLENASPRTLIPGMLLGGLVLILLIFINIFTNVWGYVAPVSTIFRNQFHLPFLIITGILTLLIWLLCPSVSHSPARQTDPISWSLGVLFAITVIVTGFFGYHAEKVNPGDPNKTSLIVMTYNIQGANDRSGEKSYERQLALIQKVSPDILSLQETDTSRISFDNNDYVRYYAARLGYYSFYGPTTVTGTFGTAILSRYPLQNTRVVFTFSDSDEIGTTEAEVNVGGRTFTIYDVHPDGSDTAKHVFAQSVINRSAGKKDVIILGDFNLRDYEEPFQLIAGVYTNVWTSVYPSKIGADGTDMSGKNRIDHIFISPDLFAQNPVYLLPPESATDHPVHWAEIFWGK